jgi:DNA-binding MarR family transcriptional regulator
MRKTYVFILSILLCSLPLQADDSAFAELARQHQYSMSEEDGVFSGPGWGLISERVARAQQVLIGEDHFTSEIPRFSGAIAGIGTFDHFYIEVDPFSTRIIERSIREMDAAQRLEFRRAYGDLYSFYALEPEYTLLEQLVEGGAGLLGSDQVVMFDDRLIFQDWIARTGNEQARQIYRHITQQSRERFERLLENPEEPDFSSLYFMTPEFTGDLERLSALELSDEERAMVEAMQRSVDIYQTRSHRTRVQLLKHQLMVDYPIWIGSRTLFKYGANHMARGESFLTVQDIGALVAELSEATYQESLHVMIIGESGAQGSPFRGFPPSLIDVNSFYLKHLQPFFPLTTGEDWAVFDLLPLRRAQQRGELAIEDTNLLRSIKGFDLLVLIPEVTPAGFPNYDSG